MRAGQARRVAFDPTMPPPVFRFAPQPNGYLHLGHALSAFLNFDMARATGGRFLLRIEDIDADALPAGIRAGDLRGSRLARHALGKSRCAAKASISRIIARHWRGSDAQGLLYPSFESRAEIAALVAERERHGDLAARSRRGAALSRPCARNCASERRRRLAAGDAHAVRLDMTQAVAKTGELSWTETGIGPAGESGMVAAAPEHWGDVVLGRKELPTSYHISVVVDDARQGVTDVVRGQDLFWSTSIHRLLQALLGLPAPVYHHHRLILDADGHKLSKSTRATALRELRAAGVAASDIRRMVGLPLPKD